MSLLIFEIPKIIEFQSWVKLELNEDVVDIDELEDSILEVLDVFNYELVPNACFISSKVREAKVCSKLISYQLKLIKMRAELANLNHCAVPF